MRWSDCQASDVRWAVCPNAKRFRGFRPPSGSALGGPGSAHRAGWFRGEFDMPLPGAAKTIQPGFAQGAADWRSGPRRSILSMLCPAHPFPLRGTSPQGETRDMREKTGSAMLHVSSRWFPLWWLAPPPCPVRSMSLDSRVAYSSPMNPVPLPPPQFGGAAKGKRLNGQARRLTSSHLEVLCRTSTVAQQTSNSRRIVSASFTNLYFFYLTLYHHVLLYYNSNK